MFYYTIFLVMIMSYTIFHVMLMFYYTIVLVMFTYYNTIFISGNQFDDHSAPHFAEAILVSLNKHHSSDYGNH